MGASPPVELVSQAMTDRAAFEELVQQYQGFVLSLARPRCPDAATADDISQEVWMIVERELVKLREPKAFMGWLARITENTTTAVLKRGTREHSIRREVSERRPAVHEPPPESESMLDERNEAVLRALRGLPEEYRIPITLRFYQGLTAREIAELLDCPLGTVLSRLFRANAMLKERLRKHIE